MTIEELEAELEVANRDANWLTEAAMEATVETAKLRAELETVKRERDEAFRVLGGLCAEFERAVYHSDWRAAGSKGMSVPCHGDFVSATQLPSAVSKMRWWAREMRKVIGDER